MSEHPDHGQTPYSPGACEECWSQAFTESRLHGGSQVEHYRRLLVENEGKAGHDGWVDVAMEDTEP
jgi:hypothetical protein